MVTQYDFRAALTGAHDRSEPSLVRRLIDAIVADRQQKADEYLAEYFRRHPEYRDRTALGINAQIGRPLSGALSWSWPVGRAKSPSSGN